jgi:glutaryl-CoA dehydrogenase
MATVDSHTDLYDIPQELKDFRDTIRQIVKERVWPRAAEIDATGEYPWDIRRLFGEQDILSLPFAEEYGGTGTGTLMLQMAVEEIAKASGSCALILMVQELGTLPIQLFGTEEQKQRWLPKCASGEWSPAFCLSEPEAGSDPGAMRTSAVRDGDEWVINGTKNWITNATIADFYVVFAVTDREQRRISAFVVEKDTPGFSTTKLEDKIALRVVQNALIDLVDVRVPEANRLAGANSFRDTAKVLLMTRAGVAWMAVGCARGAYQHALAYAKEREQFGRAIAGFQLVQDLLVRMLANTTASAALCARLSQMQDAGVAADEHASLAKAFCTVRMRETVGYARELLGGNGILLEHNVGRFVADAEAIYSYEGTREMNSLIVGRAITGQSAFV